MPGAAADLPPHGHAPAGADAEGEGDGDVVLTESLVFDVSSKKPARAAASPSAPPVLPSQPRSTQRSPVRRASRATTPHVRRDDGAGQGKFGPCRLVVSSGG